MQRILIAVLLVLVAVVGSFGWLAWQRHTTNQAALERIVSEVDLELEQAEVDRGELSRLRREIGTALDEGRLDSAALFRARARLLYALGGSDDEAWNDLQSSGLAPGAATTRADRWLGARLLARIHLSVQGRHEDGLQALQLLQEIVDREGEGDPNVLELGWLVAYRADDVPTWRRYGDALLEQHAGTEQAALVEQLRAFLTGQLALRAGLQVEPEELQRVRADASAPDGLRTLAEVCEEVLAAGEGQRVTLATLTRAADARRTAIPPELDCAIGFQRLQPQLDRAANERDADAIGRAREEIALALRKAPKSVGARHTMMVLEIAEARPETAVKHARWLLDNAPTTDARRPLWQRIAGS
jgi:hypothetical protein